MEAIGSEVGQKMRSAIKAKLMELGCYVDDELPDYVMVMVANKRTRDQMEEDLQLFLTNNTEAFVNWLHQVLQKLQEVTINKKLLSSSEKKAKSKLVEPKKDRKDKEKKKEKTGDKDKTKSKEKRSKKEKGKGKKRNSEEAEVIRPNVPPLFINFAIEPSITDVFAGQILKTHGIKLNASEKELETKTSSTIDVVSRKKLSRNKFPIIDPNSVSQVVAEKEPSTSSTNVVNQFDTPSLTEVQKERDKLAALPRDEQIREYNEINAKIQTLKQKLSQQLDSGSEDEDFINLRTEAEELIGVDLSEEIMLDSKIPPAPIISDQATKSPIRRSLSPESKDSPVKTPPPPQISRSPDDDSCESIPIKRVRTPIRAPSPDKPPELPMIELNLPKRPMRERIGMKTPGGFSDSTVARNVNKVNPFQSTVTRSSEDSYEKSRSEKQSLRSQNEKSGLRSKVSKDWDKSRRELEKDNDAKNKRRLGSRVVPLPPQPEDDSSLNSLSVASVVRAPPRPPGPTGAPVSQLLLRAVADAHKSILSMPPKNTELPLKKKALVRPMRRNIDPMKIIIQVPSENIPVSNARDLNREDSDYEIDMDTESLGDLESDGDNKKISSKRDNMEYVPESLGRMKNTKRLDYVPTHINSDEIEVPVISRVLHLKNQNTNETRRDPQFVVTLEGVNANMFLEKKLCKEIEEEKKKLNSHDKEDSVTQDHRGSSERVDSRISKADSKSSKNKSKSEEIKQNSNKSESFKNKISPDKTKVDAQSKDIVIKSKIDKERRESENDVSKNKTESYTPVKETKNLSDSNVENKIKKPITKITFNDGQKDKSASSKNDSSGDVAISDNGDVSESKGTKRKSGDDKPVNAKPRKCPSPIVFDKVKESHTSSKYSVIPPLADKKVRKLSLGRETRCKFFPDCALGPACEFYHPPLSASPSAGCRAFPNCPYGDKCAYGHPPCKFDVLCTRTGCPYSHGGQLKSNKVVNSPALSPAVASRVVPVQNYKSISASPLPAICKFYPNCVNPGCHYFHPKPCRFGKACLNKVECNFYHHDIPTSLKYFS